MRIVCQACALAWAVSFVVCLPAETRAQSICSLFACFCDRGCDSGCGCGSCCGVNGRQFAGQTWDCCREDGPRLCYCTDGYGNCNSTVCGAASCGCGVEPTCGCAGGCDRGGIRCSLFDCLFGCTGCSREFYWSEWHNDPPRCCDPCDCYGNWVGPSTYYRAPYAHPFAVHAASPAPQVANRSAGSANRAGQFAQAAPARGQSVAQRPPTPPAPVRSAQKYAAHRTTTTPPAAVARQPQTAPRTFYR